VLSPQQWYYRNIERFTMPPAVKMSLGSAVHTAVEHDLRQKVETHEDRPTNEVLDKYDAAFEEETAGNPEPDEPLGKAKDDGVRMLRVFMDGSDDQPPVAPTLQPVWVERATQFRVVKEHVGGCPRDSTCTCGVAFNVTLDMATVDDAVHDLKTTARAPSGGAHLMQVAAGAIGYEVETGRVAQDTVIDTLIRTKQAKYHRESYGPVDAHMKRIFALQVDSAVQMINAGMFPTLGTDGIVPACGSCGYKPICPAWKRKK
jgi:CRISPR/Cas system-associated exonuclease Cas4 (RecB family)